MGWWRINIGNRKTAQENVEEVTAYAANNLNQYTAVGSFVPEFDADGNQTKVQTCTGIWEVAYNAENRPVTFDRSNEDGTSTRVTCAYDYMGRRATKKVETISVPDAETGESTATTILHQRYIYRGYLQIAGFDLTESSHAFRWFITWDPTQPVATRPLTIRKDGTWYCYGWDLTKNVSEVFSNEGRISNTVIYSYTPYGAVTAEGSVTQPIQWSSEFYDDELGLVYYNYRHYIPNEGRWLSRDEKEEDSGSNLYKYLLNRSIDKKDVLGHFLCEDECDELGVSNGKVEIKVTSIYGGDWNVIQSFQNFADGFDIIANVLGKYIDDPRAEVLGLYSETLSKAADFMEFMAEPRSNKPWVVQGRMEYSVCKMESCCFRWEHKALSSQTTDWVRDRDGVIPGDSEGLKQAIKRVNQKLEKEARKAAK